MKKRKLGLIESSRRYLEPGEEVRHVFIGQTRVTPLMYLLVAPFVLIFFARQRVVLVTDRYVRVMKPNFWKGKQIDEQLAAFPIADARIETTSLGLSVNDGPRVYAFLFGFKDIEGTRAAVEAARGGGAIPEAV
jgi:hypothetical protein